MATSLTLKTTRSGAGELVLTATGEIDLSTVEPFARALNAAVAETATDGVLVVDLSAVEYLDSAGVNVMFPHADHIRVIAHPFLVRVFDISGFSELATVQGPTARNPG
ncbi:STAS domain-containing protein [Candidatus Mycobacterium wuenschmannii]|uniref:STAS domain-containing protein n=1 Tax=Candidatus Mycobacterium wuenschmannii TaxID=3027808 RepID=A0ABY8W3Y1_9MYCO|nr:STAS domain-containing protein [Candidatus Mycobacterium wuenschmannii]WIM88479.1 STAS domain-containing protein [Candidatus Mycobacterium wuenschmannii]